MAYCGIKIFKNSIFPRYVGHWAVVWPSRKRLQGVGWRSPASQLHKLMVLQRPHPPSLLILWMQQNLPAPLVCLFPPLMSYFATVAAWKTKRLMKRVNYVCAAPKLPQVIGNALMRRRTALIAMGFSALATSATWIKTAISIYLIVKKT